MISLKDARLNDLIARPWTDEKGNATFRYGPLGEAFTGKRARLAETGATFEDVGEMERALQGWDAIAPKDRLLVGVTATPNRSDAIGLGCVFQSIAYSFALRQAIDMVTPQRITSAVRLAQAYGVKRSGRPIVSWMDEAAA